MILAWMVRMRKWVVLSIVGILIFGSFVSAGDVCQGFDVDRTLSDVNLKIQNLTGLINKKEADLQELYVTFNGSSEVLERIVQLEDEVQELRSEREAYERQKLSLELIKRYTVKTPYGLQVLYYNLPKGLVKEYVEKIHPVRKNVDLDWLIAYYRQAGELTFDEYIEVDSRLREAGEVDEALKLLQKRKQIREEIYAFAREKSKLETLQKLKTLGEQQTIMKKLRIEPLSYDFGGINEGNSCSLWSCPPISYIPLPEHTSVYYTYAAPAAVWVGIYESSTPDVSKFWGQYCTYEFPYSSTDVKKYWDRAVEKAMSKGFYSFENTGSIQIKLFYDGVAYNPDSREYQVSNLIWKVDCHKNECWLTSYKPELPEHPDEILFDQYTGLYVEEYWLSCCNGGDVGNSCKWANRHCGGCFAPDAASSQNFAWVNRPYQKLVVRW